MLLNNDQLINDFLISLSNLGFDQFPFSDSDISFYLPLFKEVLKSNKVSYKELSLPFKGENKNETHTFKKMIISAFIKNPNLGWVSDDGFNIVLEKTEVKKINNVSFKVANQFVEIYTEVLKFQNGDEYLIKNNIKQKTYL